jgi:hypothetical protein
MTDEEIFKCIQATDQINTNTKKAYIQRLKSLSKTYDRSLIEILKNPKDMIDLLKSKHAKMTTFKNTITPILAMVRYCPDLKKYEAEVTLWKDALDSSFQKIEEDVMKGNVSKRMLDGYIPFGEFAKKRLDLPVGSYQRLLVACYSLVPPLRADWNRVAVYEELPKDPEPNHILIKRRVRTTDMILTIGEFKTAKTFGKLTETLPRELVKEIQKSLEMNPREWLFINRQGEPFTASGFSKFTLEWFKKIYKKPITIQILRHSFLSAIDWNQLTLEQRQELGATMGHSWQQGQRYVWTRIDELLKKNNDT